MAKLHLGRTFSVVIRLLPICLTMVKGVAETTFGPPLAIRGFERGGRTAFRRDPIEEQIVRGTWRAPDEGTGVSLGTNAPQVWQSISISADGVVSNSIAGGYVYLPVVADRAEVKILEVAGDGMVYVNGEPRVGDPYQNDSVVIPVSLRAGTNDFLFQGGRGRMHVKLSSPTPRAFFSNRDFTLPDLLAGSTSNEWGAAVVINGTERTLNDLKIRAMLEGGTTVESVLPSIPPFGMRKMPFQIHPPKKNGSATNEIHLKLTLLASRESLHSVETSLRIRSTKQSYKRTFRSEIDGSVQYYAVNPPASGNGSALFLSTHGAGVEAMGQADAYSPKNWGYIVAPTNRRPYGFDWEDWGRRDAIEVLDIAQKSLGTDPARTYLTGHSMGGHGVWQIGVTLPDRFAAVGPSAGWISFASYGGGRGNAQAQPTPLEAMVSRAANSSDTLLVASNYLHHGIYILHGTDDDNVPVTEARKMKEVLGGFHHDFDYHEEPNAGHWWDVSDEPGSDCVDWAPMFDLFARHRIPANNEIREIRFSTVNPGVSARSHWISIEAQEHILNRSSVVIRVDPLKRRFVGATENVARLRLDHPLVEGKDEVTLEMDHQNIKIKAGVKNGEVWLQNVAGTWLVTEAPPAGVKTPAQCGPFKEAFGHRMIFVYGTHGTSEENRWALAKARFDAESFWYRGNGSIDVIGDTEFGRIDSRDRSILIYGHAESNSAWKSLLGESPVQVNRGSVRVGARMISGDDLSCLFIRPRPGSAVASVGVISGTGMAGFRLTDRVPYFMAGVAYPDLTVFSPDSLQRKGEGIRAAGFFGNDWSVENGEFAWE